MLELNNVEVLYSDVILAVKGISAKVPDASCVTLLGANGAGKSTTLKAISNLIKTEDGRVSAGRIDFGGQAITGHEPSGIVRQGIVHVMEGRKVLRHMSVEQNLVVGGHMSRTGDAKQRLDEVYGRISRLAALRHRTAGYLSGGEQQLLVIGRALMARPKLVMIDEPSLGLAPLMVDEVYGLLASLKASGLTLLIVEQSSTRAMMAGGRMMPSFKVTMPLTWAPCSGASSGGVRTCPSRSTAAPERVPIQVVPGSTSRL